MTSRARHRRRAAGRMLAATRLDERRVRREQDGLRHLVVLGLREEVHRDPVGIRVDRRRSRGSPRGRPPCRCRPRRTRAAWPRRRRRCRGRRSCPPAGTRRGAVGERADRLRAADARRRGPRRRAPPPRAPSALRSPSGRRHHHDELGDAGHLRRHRVHQHRRRIGRLAAGHVEADAVERRHAAGRAPCRRPRA